MQIELKKLSPVYLEKEKIENSQIWEQELIFKKGEKVQIIAPSGSGKTSFIHFLYRLRGDYSGEILFDNANLRNMDADTVAHYRAESISIQFQDLRLFPSHSGLQNIKVKQQLRPFDTGLSIDEMAARLGVENKLAQNASLCSYGEQQRIALVRALQQPFDFILLDEPFGHLDETNRHKAMQLIEEQAALRNAGILLADLKPLEFFNADRILYL